MTHKMSQQATSNTHAKSQGVKEVLVSPRQSRRSELAGESARFPVIYALTLINIVFVAIYFHGLSSWQKNLLLTLAIAIIFHLLLLGVAANPSNVEHMRNAVQKRLEKADAEETPEYQAGFTAGHKKGYEEGQDSGRKDGYDAGYKAGYYDGDEDCYEPAYNAGYSQGEEHGKHYNSQSAFDKGRYQGCGQGF